MGYFSELTLSRTAEDAELDAGDGFTPPATPRPIAPPTPTIAYPARWPAPEFPLGALVYRAGQSEPRMIVGLELRPYTTRAPIWLYRLAHGTTREMHEYMAEDLSPTPWCACAEFCAGVATTVIAGVRYCAECAELRDAENQPF